LPPEEWEADVRARALLQRLCESCRTWAGDFHARGGRCHTPVRFHARRFADTPGRGRHPGGAGRNPSRLLHAATARASASLAAEHHLSLCRWLLCEEEIYGCSCQPRSACDHQTAERRRLHVSLHRTAPEAPWGTAQICWEGELPRLEPFRGPRHTRR